MFFRFSIFAVALFVSTAGISYAQNKQASPARDCGALASTNFTGLTDAPTQITTAELIAAAGDLPAYCRVEAYVAPQVWFELRLPAETWNQKFLMQGCGGMCGWVNMGACEDALARDYAVANTDMGHRAPPFSALWARNNRQAEIDFAYRATHVVAVAAKAIIEKYYGRPQRYAYFRGCSTGGRQALIAAQRYPQDFDGIIAGAPVLRQPGVGPLHLAWLARANMDASGQPILTAEKVPLIARSVIAACDNIDGVTDGVINDPRQCDWSPRSMACESPDAADCLTAAEIEAVEKIYSPATDSTGHPLFPGGMMRGSESEWAPAIAPPAGQPSMLADDNGLIAQVLRYLSFAADKGPEFGIADLDFDRHPAEFAYMAGLNSAVNPNLEEFRSRGGKLMMYHGWNDLEVPPMLSIDYFESVLAFHGDAQTQSFARLYMLPGVAHCRRGAGADAIDFLSYIEGWVERGEAPDVLTAHHLTEPQSYLGLPRLRFPLATSQIEWTRPVFPYPDTAAFTGGDWRMPKSWARKKAATR